MTDDSFSASAFSFFLPFYFLKWVSALAHQFHILRQEQSTMAEMVEMAVAGCSLTSCV